MVTKSRLSSYWFCLALVLVFISSPAIALAWQSDVRINKTSSENQTRSPYFVVISNDSVSDLLPLKASSATVNITGVIADVELTQQYVNKGKTTLEAVYVFPMSTRAAVYAMEMQVGNRKIRARIQEKNKARKQYEQAKKEGRRVSLLEQNRPNVFSIKVATISPGDTINLVLNYTELLIPENGVYSFVFPTVVGPRYSSGNETAENEFVETPYTRKGIDSSFRFNFGFTLNAGMPIQEVVCNTHKFNLQYPAATKVSMQLDASDKNPSNRDIIIRYSLRGNEIHSGVLLYKNGNENHFLMMIQPPARFKKEDIPPREYIFVLDISGSMNGFPLEISKKLMRSLIAGLKPTDQFNLVLFAGGSALFNPVSVKANPENMAAAIRLINSKQGSGGTELQQALEKAYAIPQPLTNCSRSIILLSDGYISAEKNSMDLVEKQLGSANFFCFGIGTSVNRYLMEGLAFLGKGEAIIVESNERATEAADKFRKYIETPLLSNISVNYGNWQVYDVEPKNIPDLMAERPLIIHGKYKGLALGKVSIKANTGKSDFQQEINLNPLKPDPANKALPLLWAREKIRKLEYYGEAINKLEITNLGLKYQLMTSQTSFIAIDEKTTAAKAGNQKTVKQPLTLPAGVSELAVGEIMETLDVVEEDYEFSLSGTNLTQEESEIVFVVVETMPQYPGGDTALMEFIAKNLVYPEKAVKENLYGRVILQFTVDKNGDIQDVVVVRSVSPELDAEAIRIVKSMPRWIPGKQRGKTVAVKYTLPINFKLTK